jgi:8-oxo-dGTP pyrophosphatase MutT (NUDIX family)
VKLDLEPPEDGRYHQYCWGCRAEAVETLEPVDGRIGFRCAACGGTFPRTLAIGPDMRWWVDTAGEYWHESAGVFVHRADGRYLFFERTFFPLEWTVPAGHVDVGEDPRIAAARELVEEVGLSADPHELVPLGVDDIAGDSCWRGSDAHRWHPFRLEVPAATEVQVLQEGRRPTWLPLGTALEKKLTVPVRYVIERYRGAGLD